MSVTPQSVKVLHHRLQNLSRLLIQARKYQFIELESGEHTLDLPLSDDVGEFMQWVLDHKKPMMDTLHITGRTKDLTKSVRVEFLVGEFPFTQKGVGVGMLRECLKRLVEVSNKDKVGVVVGTSKIYLPREMEATIIYSKSLTPDTKREFESFKKLHRRIALMDLGFDALEYYSLDHPLMPWFVEKLSKEEAKHVIPKLPLKLNELPSHDIMVKLIGAVPGEIVQTIIALKNGTNLKQNWKIVKIS